MGFLLCIHIVHHCCQIANAFPFLIVVDVICFTQKMVFFPSVAPKIIRIDAHLTDEIIHQCFPSELRICYACVFFCGVLGSLRFTPILRSFPSTRDSIIAFTISSSFSASRSSSHIPTLNSL